MIVYFTGTKSKNDILTRKNTSLPKHLSVVSFSDTENIFKRENSGNADCGTQLGISRGRVIKKLTWVKNKGNLR